MIATSVRRSSFQFNPDTHPNTNDLICAWALGASEHVPADFDLLSGRGVVFATMWKVREPWENRWMDVLHRLKGETSVKVVLFQEGETSWPTSRPWVDLKSFIDLLGKVDLFLTHNERDVEFWGRFRSGLPTFRWRTCLNLDHITPHRIEPKGKTHILCGSSFDSRANGLAGLIACEGLAPLLVQNRSVGYEEREFPGFEYERIPHLGWSDWLKSVSRAKIAVHPMPAAAAGRDQIAFAALGIPCVGNRELDLQRELFPNLCIHDLYSPLEIRNTVVKVLGNAFEFHDARDYAMKRVEKLCSIESAEHQAKRILKEIHPDLSRQSTGLDSLVKT